MPRYSLTSVFSGSIVPRRDHRISATMSKLLGGSIASWKCPDASMTSFSQRKGSMTKNRAYSCANRSTVCAAISRAACTSAGDEMKTRCLTRMILPDRPVGAPSPLLQIEA